MTAVVSVGVAALMTGRGFMGSAADMGRYAEWLPSRFLPACGLLVAVVLAVLPVVVWRAAALDGSPGVSAAVVAGLVCLAGGVGALAATRFLQLRGNAMAGLLLSIFLRTGFPLLAVAVLSSASPLLARGNVFRSAVVFYLVVLTVETVLSVRMVNESRRGGGVC